MTLEIDDNNLTIQEVYDFVASNQSRIVLSNTSIKRIKESSHFFDDLYNKDQPCYGLNTGFGSMIGYKIDHAEQVELQKRLAFSHSVGIGKHLTKFQCKLVFFLRILCLAKGHSGITYTTICFLIELYNKGVVPRISSEGSLGASGDLSPLSNFACFLIGEGQGWYQGDIKAAKEIYSLIGFEPLILRRKEGLSLINGTSVMTAMAIENFISLNNLFNSFISLYCYCIKVFNIPYSFINDRSTKTKPHKGSIFLVKEISRILGSLNTKENISDLVNQEVYSIRCVPFILAPVVDSLEYYRETIKVELNSSNDNPIYLFERKELYHGGNFHGGVLSFATDQTRHAISLIAGVVDRQIEHILNIKNGIIDTPFLSNAPNKGYMGFEGAQYLVTSLSSEISYKSNPFFKPHPSANSGNQDFVSFGLQSNITLNECIESLEKILIVYSAIILQKACIDNFFPNQLLNSIFQNELSKYLPYEDSYPFTKLVKQLQDIDFLKLISH